MSANSPKIAFITGITGQDGAYLAELLLKKGYIVHGLVRRSSLPNTERIARLFVAQSRSPNQPSPTVSDRVISDSALPNDSVFEKPLSIQDRLVLHYGDMTDAGNLQHLVQKIRPDEIYNLAAQSHVKISFETAEYTSNVNGLGTLRLLEAIRSSGLERRTRFYQASTSELYGEVRETPQSETTPFAPRSPYAISKLFAYWCTVHYREAYNMFACNGILFNHESPFRGENFVTRKIAIAAVRIAQGLQDVLRLGNIDAKRDWGHAVDYVEGMWLMLQQERADDYVLATGETHTVREFVELAFEEVGIPLIWEGEGTNCKGIDRNSGQVRVAIDPQFYRPSEVELLLGNPEKASRQLGWKAKTSFRQLVLEMVRSEQRRVG
ncbi:MAG: GDP-mannose 4,6-dehydratase [Thermoguttaceae bacterium]